LRISRGDVIAGLNALDLRKYFRAHGDGTVSYSTAREEFIRRGLRQPESQNRRANDQYFFAGDDSEAKQKVGELIERSGL
jgi:hypothetical protein